MAKKKTTRIGTKRKAGSLTLGPPRQIKPPRPETTTSRVVSPERELLAACAAELIRGGGPVSVEPLLGRRLDERLAALATCILRDVVESLVKGDQRRQDTFPRLFELLRGIDKKGGQVRLALELLRDAVHAQHAVGEHEALERLLAAYCKLPLCDRQFHFLESGKFEELVAQTSPSPPGDGSQVRGMSGLLARLSLACGAWGYTQNKNETPGAAADRVAKDLRRCAKARSDG